MTDLTQPIDLTDLSCEEEASLVSLRPSSCPVLAVPSHLKDSVVTRPSVAAFLWSRTSLLKEFSDLVQEFGRWPGAVIEENRFGLRFTLDGLELGQLNWGGRFVLVFEPEAGNAIMAEKMAEVDPDQPHATAFVIDITSGNDLNQALGLLRFAYLALDLNQNMLPEESDAPFQLSLKNVDRAGDGILPFIAHELRQPLSAIILALEAARNEQGGESNAHWAGEIARNQAQHMSRIIDDMLDTFCYAPMAHGLTEPGWIWRRSSLTHLRPLARLSLPAAISSQCRCRRNRSSLWSIFHESYRFSQIF